MVYDKGHRPPKGEKGSIVTQKRLEFWSLGEWTGVIGPLTDWRETSSEVHRCLRCNGSRWWQSRRLYLKNGGYAVEKRLSPCNTTVFNKGRCRPEGHECHVCMHVECMCWLALERRRSLLF